MCVILTLISVKKQFHIRYDINVKIYHDHYPQLLKCTIIPQTGTSHSSHYTAKKFIVLINYSTQISTICSSCLSVHLGLFR